MPDILRGLVERIALVPRRNDLDRLKTAVTFSETELASLLQRYRSSLEDLSPLIVNCGQMAAELYELDHGPLFQTPIVKSGDKYVVALPAHLAGAIRHAIITNFKNASLLPVLASNYADSVWLRVLQVLGWIAIHPSTITLPPQSTVPNLREKVFVLDNDKFAYVSLLTDQLSEYDSGNAHGHWDSASLGTAVGERMRVVDDYLRRLDPRPTDVLFLPLVQGLGRSFVFGINTEGISGPVMTLGAADLESLALHDFSPLTLWKFAKARIEIRGRTDVQAFTPLDEYLAYRSRASSYYFRTTLSPHF